MYPSASASTYSEQDRPADQKSLEILFRELLSISDRIFKCSGRLNNMADRAFGPVPSSGEKAGDGPVQQTPPMMDSLVTAVSQIQTAINRLEGNIERIERIV